MHEGLRFTVAVTGCMVIMVIFLLVFWVSFTGG